MSGLAGQPRALAARYLGIDGDPDVARVGPMSTGLVLPRLKKASRPARSRSVKSRAGAGRRLKLDAEETALHAAISAAVARNLGR